VDAKKMSDLALCCEYLTLDKTCSAVVDSQKAKDKRQIKPKMKKSKKLKPQLFVAQHVTPRWRRKKVN
jgi:hypothetical protein